MSPREAANIHPEKHNILVFLSNTLFPPFYVLFPPFSQFQKMGGTWEERFRFTFVTSLLSNRYQSEVLSKRKRSCIEHLSKTYRTSIEEIMGQIFYPPPYGLSVMPKKGVPIFILTHPLFITFFIGNKSQCGKSGFYFIIPKSLRLEALNFFVVFSAHLQASMAFKSASVALRKFLYFAT